MMASFYYPNAFEQQARLMIHKSLLILSALVMLASCKSETLRDMVGVEKEDQALDAIITDDFEVEVIGENYSWSEGPLWVEEHQMLLFSDVPENRIYKWTAQEGVSVYLQPSGYTGDVPRGGEMGSNGLTLSPEGNLVMCQHGDRRIAMMDASLSNPQSRFKTIADRYNNKKFDSPNDLVYKSNGDLFFTDPPYGLEKNDDDPAKEAAYQGVYKVSRAGEVTLLLDSLTRPNGIAFLPGEKTLLISNSDPGKAHWYAYDLTNEDSLSNGRLFFDATPFTDTQKGLPDGLKVDRQGNVFASGPGGIWIFDSTGKVLGKLATRETASNCSLSADGKTIFITNDSFVLRVRLRN